MSRQLLIYIAGPYRAEHERGVVLNIRKAEELALEVWRRGHAALCPHKNTALFGGACPDETWLNGDITMMLRCDAVLLVEGWERSSGTRAEVEEAKKWGLPVFETLGDLDAWAMARLTATAELIWSVRTGKRSWESPFVVEPVRELTFAALRAKSEARGERWRNGQPTLPLSFAMMELAGEGGEAVEAMLKMTVAIGKACNEAKKLERAERGMAGGKADNGSLADELADVVICADLAAQRAGVDLGRAVVRKFNATSDKHGFPERLREPVGGDAAAAEAPELPGSESRGTELPAKAGNGVQLTEVFKALEHIVDLWNQEVLYRVSSIPALNHAAEIVAKVRTQLPIVGYGSASAQSPVPDPSAEGGAL